jgi:hypothetical protein
LLNNLSKLSFKSKTGCFPLAKKLKIGRQSVFFCLDFYICLKEHKKTSLIIQARFAILPGGCLYQKQKAINEILLKKCKPGRFQSFL